MNNSKDLINEESHEQTLLKLTDLLINQEGTATK